MTKDERQSWEVSDPDEEERVEEHAEEHERQVADVRWAFFGGLITGVVTGFLLMTVVIGSRFFR